MPTDSQASVLSTRLRALPWALREAGRFLRARLRGEPPLHDAALAWARSTANPGDPASVLAALDRFAVERRFLMNVGNEKGPLLERLVREKGPQARILELGSFVGYSAILMGRHLGPGGQLLSIDASPRSSRVARAMADLAGLGDRVEFLHGKSGEVIPDLSGPFDLIFLDHWKGQYRKDAEALVNLGLLRPGAVVIADNVGPLFGDNPYVPWMRARADFSSEYIRSRVEYQEIEDGVMVSRYNAASPTEA